MVSSARRSRITTKAVAIFTRLIEEEHRKTWPSTSP